MKKFPIILLTLYIIYFIVLAINPYDRAVWFAENLPIVLIVLGIVWIHIKKHKFSNLSLILMAFLVFMHTTGGHFTFERVPFDFITNLFNFERNHFDRIAHFSVGFYGFAIAELMLAKKSVNSKSILFLFPIFTIFTVASVYEIIEWWYAATAGGEQGIAFLGSQGDVWDAQKDMLADGLGAIFVMILFFVLNRDKIKKLVK
ncbi:MAG: DUF2238 domain-containing protein [Candidatus Gracilibacteria bacterium]|nr:DUF2238 domain-containing protein [Candidatus Gracilibacteria bacterium]